MISFPCLLFVFLPDTIARKGWIAGLSLLATSHQSANRGGVKSSKSTQDGCDWARWSICEDLSSVQPATYRQEENAREETYAQSGVQWIVRLRYTERRGRAQQRQPGVHATGLGPSHKEWGKFYTSIIQDAIFSSVIDRINIRLIIYIYTYIYIYMGFRIKSHLWNIPKPTNIYCCAAINSLDHISRVLLEKEISRHPSVK